MTIYATFFVNLHTVYTDADKSLLPDILYVEAEDDVSAMFERLEQEGYEDLDPGFCGDSIDQIAHYMLVNYDVVVAAKAIQEEADAV